jgi:hypothetical protein
MHLCNLQRCSLPFGFVLFCLSLTPLSTWQSADAQEYFNGYPCTQDCSGHEAGYEWAQQNGITNPGDCNGNSQSFNEGCESYTEENQITPDEDDSSDADSGDEGDAESE